MAGRCWCRSRRAEAAQLAAAQLAAQLLWCMPDTVHFIMRLLWMVLFALGRQDHLSCCCCCRCACPLWVCWVTSHATWRQTCCPTATRSCSCSFTTSVAMTCTAASSRRLVPVVYLHAYAESLVIEYGVLYAHFRYWGLLARMRYLVHSWDDAVLSSPCRHMLLIS
jgi:hypothetical protein